MLSSFVSCIGIVTLDNWFNVMRAGHRNAFDFTINSIYLGICIIIGNFIILNLYIANMIEGFELLHEEELTDHHNK